MKILSIYIETEKLKKGLDCFADVDIDMERDDGKSIIIRVPLKPNEISSGMVKPKRTSTGRYDYSELSRADCIPTIKKHIGEVVMNKLFEGEEQLENLGK
jgi:hypothetical protein